MPPSELTNDELDKIIELVQAFAECRSRRRFADVIRDGFLPMINADFLGCAFVHFEPPLLAEDMSPSFITVNTSPGDQIGFEMMFGHHDEVVKVLTAKPDSVIASGIDMPADQLTRARNRVLAENPSFDRASAPKFMKAIGHLVIVNPPDMSLGASALRLSATPFTAREKRIAKLIQPTFVSTMKKIAVQEAVDTLRALVDALGKSGGPVAIVDRSDHLVFANDGYRTKMDCDVGDRIDAAMSHLIMLDRISRNYDIENSARRVPRFLTVDGVTHRVESTLVELEYSDYRIVRLRSAEDSLSSVVRQVHKQDFTVRETEVALLVRDGLSNGQIAAKLFVSINTVKSHVRRCHKKMGTRSRAELTSKLSR